MPCILDPAMESGRQRGMILAAIAPHDPLQARALALDVLETAGAISRARDAPLGVVAPWQALGESALRQRLSPFALRNYLRSEYLRVRTSLTEMLHELAGRVSPSDVRLTHGVAEEVICDLAIRRCAELVVAGSTALHGFAARLFGDTATRLAARLPCALIIVSASRTNPYPALPRATVVRGQP